MNKKKLFGELKIFEILKEEILDLDIKDSETNIIIDRIAALTARLYEKGVAFQRFKPGDDVYVIERDESNKAVDYSGYMCIAVSENAVVLSSYINDLEDITDTLEYHIKETAESLDTHLAVFPLGDCYSTAEEAKKAIDDENNLPQF